MHRNRMAAVSTHDCMQANEIREGGARELARALENTCITHLDMSVCWKEGMEYMVVGRHL